MRGKNKQVKKSKNQQGRDRRIARRVVEWFDSAARPLPWRRTVRGRRCPWAALVAEAMLQQTQIARVASPFESFLHRFPTPAELAAADEQEVLAHWQGLGYYRRARHLHQAAKMVVERFNGKIPHDVDSLLQLPGVGRYTAGAVASIAFGKAEPIVDANVYRVLARLEAAAAPADDRSSQAWTWERAGRLVKAAKKPGRFNEGLMELGSTICTPRNPRCSDCPLARHCKAKSQSVQNDVPPPKQPAKRTIVHHHAVLIQRGTLVLIEQRPPTGLWARMWQLPTIESAVPLTLGQIADRLAVRVTSLKNGGCFAHQTTHRAITFHVLTARSRSRSGIWPELTELHDLPMSNAQRRIIREFTGAEDVPVEPGLCARPSSRRRFRR